MPTTQLQPCCSGRLARPYRFQPLILLLVGIAWSTTAIVPLSASESVLRLVGLTERPQQRLPDEARTIVSNNPFQRTAEKWLATNGAPPKAEQAVHRSMAPASKAISENVATEILPTQFSSLFNPQVEPAMQVEDAPVLAGDERCYVSKPLAELTAAIGLPQGKLPADAAALCAATIGIQGDRRQEFGWAMTESHWAATGMCHRPLYFEEENLERHGYTPSWVFQPLISGARFFLTIPALPYKMVLDPPRKCSYTLGHYRPGSCAPRRWYRIPLRAGAGVVEAGVIVGLVFLIP